MKKLVSILMIACFLTGLAACGQQKAAVVIITPKPLESHTPEQQPEPTTVSVPTPVPVPTSTQTEQKNTQTENWAVGAENPYVETQPTETITTGKRNALSRAQDYLEYFALSYSGMIEQLEYDGFTHSEAVYAADNCGADWYVEATVQAVVYLSLFPYSRSSLIDQLRSDGFTYDQAVYAVDMIGY